MVLKDADNDLTHVWVWFFFLKHLPCIGLSHLNYSGNPSYTQFPFCKSYSLDFFYDLLKFVCSIPATLRDAASSSPADSAEAGSRAAEGALSLSQH